MTPLPYLVLGFALKIDCASVQV